MEKFCWVCDVGAWKILWLSFGYVRIYLCMGMNLWGFFFFNFFNFLIFNFLSWTCRNFFAWLWKNLVVVYGYVKIFYFGGALKFFYFFFILCVSGSGALVLRIFFFLVWKFLVMWVLVKEIDELNFCVAEPQESRQSPNVEKCMGNIVSQHQKHHQ